MKCVGTKVSKGGVFVSGNSVILSSLEKISFNVRLVMTKVFMISIRMILM